MVDEGSEPSNFPFSKNFCQVVVEVIEVGIVLNHLVEQQIFLVGEDVFGKIAFV